MEPGFEPSGFQNDVTGPYKGFQVGSPVPPPVPGGIDDDGVPRRRRRRLEEVEEEARHRDEDFHLLLS